MYSCGICKDKGCRRGGKDSLPKNCPILETDVEDTLSYYQKAENFELAYNSALVEAEGYCKRTRMEEIIHFANKCGFKNLGLAFCVGLANETKILHKILKANGFEINSVACKTESIPKENLGIKENEKVRHGTYEPMCNPIKQAQLLNKANTDLNILLGLCVGHDSLFIKYSQAPVTVLAVKDRVLAHNPLGALYCAEGYYKNKLFPSE